MRTILVIYTDKKIENVGYIKRYAFNTENDVEEGDMLKSSSYNTNMQIVEVLDEEFKYFNRVTGEMSNVMNNSNAFLIRKLEISDTKSDTIVATRIKE